MKQKSMFLTAWPNHTSECQLAGKLIYPSYVSIKNGNSKRAYEEVEENEFSLFCPLSIGLIQLKLQNKYGNRVYQKQAGDRKMGR